MAKRPVSDEVDEDVSDAVRVALDDRQPRHPLPHHVPCHVLTRGGKGVGEARAREVGWDRVCCAAVLSAAC
eukprot:372542-Rhodomonas_salina.1